MNQVHPAAGQRLVSNVVAANVKRLSETLQNRVLNLPHRTASLSLARAGLLRILSGLGVAIPTTVAASGGTRSTGGTCAHVLRSQQMYKIVLFLEDRDFAREWE